MPSTTACPDVILYQRLVSGQLPEAEKEALLVHLEGCDACARKLGALTERDTLPSLLRQAETLGEGASRETIVRLVESLSKLRPGASIPAAPPVAARLEITVDALPASGVDKDLCDFLAPPQAPDELGRLGPYRILEVLGAGGMGVVFRAEDPQLMRLVALKAMLPALAAGEGARQRFLREARAVAAIKHDHIVTIHQVGEDHGVPFLAMEFLEGEPLDVRLERESKLPVSEVLRIGREMAEGLAAAHERNLIHRDIKPGNIWLEKRSGERGASAPCSRVKILDFGLARSVGAETQVTQLGVIVGTPAYMAPEQAQGKIVDHRCDLFSLGCVLYRMATGTAAFRGTDLVSTIMAVNTHHPTPPHQLEAALPPALSELIMSLLAKEAGDRPASARAVAETLERIAHEPASPPALPPLARPVVRRKWPIVAGVAAGLLVALASLWAAGVFKLKTKDGTIVLEDLPADAQVLVDGDVVQIERPGEGKPIVVRVAPGKRKLEIKADGFKMETQDVTLAAGENKPIHIRLEPVAGAPDKATAGKGLVDAAWLKEVAALPPAQQVQSVAAKLKELNPSFPGPLAPVIEGRIVTGLEFRCTTVTDISPLRALPGLRALIILHGPLADLSPLKDMKLTTLICRDLRVSDLTPLKDMKLTTLQIEGSLVSDLSPLKDMELTSLVCEGSPVSNLTPLKNMKLRLLWIRHTEVSDLTPLKDMKLTDLQCSETKVSDLTSLKNMQLTRLNCIGLPVTADGLMPLQEMSSLRTLEICTPKMTDAGLAHLGKLTDLAFLNLCNCKLTGAGLVHLKGMISMQRLLLSNTEMSDEGLVHLKGLLGLRELHLNRTRVTDAGLEHLASLKNITQLNLKGTAVTTKGVAKLKAALPNCNIIADVKVPATEPAATPPAVRPVPPSAALEALRRDKISPEGLAAAGDGDPKRAPARLVGVLGDAQPVQGGFVRALAFSGDGRWLASGCDDKTIVLREAATGRARKLWRGHGGSIRSVAFSKDGQTLASAATDGTVKLWPVEKAGGPQTLQPELGEIWGMAVSADGRFMAVGGTTGGVKLWKWGQWKAPLNFPADPTKSWSSFTGWKNNHSLALSSDGQYLAIRTQENKTDAPVYLFKTADGKLVKTLPGTWSGDDRVYYPMVMTFSADGKYLASWASDKTATVWGVASGKRFADFPSAQFGAVAISPDNEKIAIVRNFTIGVEVHNLATQKLEQVVMHRNKDGMSAAFSPDGKTLAAGFADGAVYLWNTTNWQEKYLERGHGRTINSVQFSSDGRSVLSAGDDSTVRRWDLNRPGQNRILRKIETRLNYACSSPDGKKYVTLANLPWPRNQTQTVGVWDSASDTELFVVKQPVGLDGIVFSPDGKLLAGSSWPANDAEKATFVYLWDAETGATVHRFATLGDLQHCTPAFSKDGKLLIAASQKQLQVWAVSSGNELHAWQDDLMCAVAFNPDGQTLATGHTNGTITVWDLAARKKKKSFTGHIAQVRSLKYTPDGKRLVSSGDDGTIRIWNPEWERAVDVIALGPANGRLVMDLDPSGRYVVAAGNSPVIYVLRLP